MFDGVDMLGGNLLAQLLGNAIQNAQQPSFGYRGNVGGQLEGQIGGAGAAPYVGGAWSQDPYLDVDNVGGPLANVRSIARGRIDARQAGRAQRGQERIASRFDGSPDADSFGAPGVTVDGGQIFESANLGGLWKRTGIILECPMNSAQQSVGAGASLAMSVEPEREVEVMGYELSVEGGATNIEYQETQRASFGITALAVGQDSMRASSGEGAGTLLSSDKAMFRGFVAKSGRNINLTLKNNGVAATVNVSAITQYVTPVRG